MLRVEFYFHFRMLYVVGEKQSQGEKNITDKQDYLHVHIPTNGPDNCHDLPGAHVGYRTSSTYLFSQDVYYARS